jgi:hypothetical protein
MYWVNTNSHVRWDNQFQKYQCLKLLDFLSSFLSWCCKPILQIEVLYYFPNLKEEFVQISVAKLELLLLMEGDFVFDDLWKELFKFKKVWDCSKVSFILTTESHTRIFLKRTSFNGTFISFAIQQQTSWVQRDLNVW